MMETGCLDLVLFLPFPAVQLCFLICEMGPITLSHSRNPGEGLMDLI